MGFRKGHSVEDQILRFTQRISYGFHKKETSDLVLLDFSKAYDTVWRQRLLQSMLDIGVPAQYVLLLQDFLRNRQARVRFNGQLSKSRKMCQGLPQGSVLAPLLFLFYINNLAPLLHPDLTVSMYADDVSILASDSRRERAEEMAQDAVHTVHKWSQEWKLNLNGDKSEVSVFSKRKYDIGWTPKITIGGNTIRCENFPRLLGVTLDRNLTFGKHVEGVVAKVARKIPMLRAVANSTWGWRKGDLGKVYNAHFVSLLHFAGSAWQPWLKPTNVGKLQVAQNRCLRLITTQARSSPTPCLHLETGIRTVDSTIKAKCLISFEKAMRLAENHPRRVAATDSVRERLKSVQTFRSRARELALLYPSISRANAPRIPLNPPDTPPWERGLKDNISISPNLHGVKGRGDSATEIRLAALRRTIDLRADFTIYTDGSASDGTMNGGAGVIITTGDPSNPEVVDRLLQKGASLTSSFAEEMRAMIMALGWIGENCREGGHVLILTDSKSLCSALIGQNTQVDHVRRTLNELSSIVDITIQWVPGHCGVPGNELADIAAKEASELPGADIPAPISFSTHRDLIERTVVDPPPSHQRTRDVYRSISLTRDAQRRAATYDAERSVRHCQAAHWPCQKL